MTGQEIRVEEVPLGSPRIRLLARFPWRLYRGDPYWTPPLTGELLGNRLLGLVGLLTPQHPYHKHADVSHFVAWRDGRLMGTVSTAVNHRFNQHHNGKFGFFEVVEDYGVACALLDSARRWTAERGMTVLRGPGEYSNATHERQGVLIEGFQHPPTVEMKHNPPYYAGFLERYGFRKAKDYHAHISDVKAPLPERLERLAREARSRRKIETRPLVLKDLVREVRLVTWIYNQAWKDNWGFLPVTDDEADLLATMLRPIVDPDAVRFGYVNGEPAAVLGAFPDPNWALRPRWRWYGDSDLARLARLFLTRSRIPRARLMFFGVVPAFRNMGLDAVLYDEVKRHGLKGRYQSCETSLLLEDNDLIIKAAEFMGAKRYKTWRIYDLDLG